MESSNYPPATGGGRICGRAPRGRGPVRVPRSRAIRRLPVVPARASFARLSHNRGLLILLIIAFLLLVIGPSLFYILNPPRPRPPLPVRGQGIPAMNAPAPGAANAQPNA